MTKSLAMVTLAAVALVAGTPSSAEAKPPKLAVTAIEGDASGGVSDAVIEALDGDDLTVISPRVVNKAVDKLGLDSEMSEKQAKKLSSEVDADALAVGRLTKEGGNKKLHFAIFVHGKKARGFSVTFSNAKSERFKSKLRDKMVSKIQDETASKTSEEGGDEEDPIAKKKKKGGDDEDGEPVAKKKKKKGGDEEAESEDEDDKPRKKKKKVASSEEEEGEDGELEVHASASAMPKHSANRAAARLDVGISFKNRGLTWNNRANFPEGPKAFNNAQVPGARFDAELYPLAFSNPKSVAAGLGLAVEYDKTLTLTLHDMDEPGVPIKGNQQSYSVGARFRVVLGSTAMSPSITAGIGYGKHRYTTDRSGLMMPERLGVPDVNYTVIDPGLTFRIPIVPAVALSFGGRGWIITDAGPIQQPTSYGRAKVFGASASAGLDIVLGNRFAIRAAGEFSQVGFSFTGTGELARDQDKDPDTKDVGGMTDRSVGGSLTLGVLY